MQLTNQAFQKTKGCPEGFVLFWVLLYFSYYCFGLSHCKFLDYFERYFHELFVEMDTVLFLTTSLKPSCQWILWVLNWLALSSKLCWISNLKMHEMNEWNTYKKWSLKRKEKSPLRKENVRWEKQVSKKFVLIREINKEDLRPSQLTAKYLEFSVYLHR